MTMTTRLIVAAAILAAPLVAYAAQPGDRPNILVIMADDLGYSDVGCYGGEIRTPTLDSLAAGGVRFTQFYNTGRCCPTRAALLTGLYPHQTGVGHMMQDRGHDGYRGDLNDRNATIAEVLRSAGYATYMTGKWHVTRKLVARSDADRKNWPMQRGFDRFYGTIHGGGSYYDPNTLTRGNESVPPEGDDFFYTDAIADNAARFIDEHDKARPFFMYVAFTAPHWPMHERETNIAKYKGVYDKGWDAIRAERHNRMIDMGIVEADWPLTPRDPAAPKWEDEARKQWQIRCMEVYAAMVDGVDQGIGRIVESLKRNGQFENTLILFLADNGGCAEDMGRRGAFTPRPDKPVAPSMNRGDIQLDAKPKFTRDGYPVRQGEGVMPGPADTYIAYGLPWANASNTPFRLYKHFVHEGGIASPLIAHWPKGIDRRGKLEHQPGHVIDLMATCVDLAGATYPTQRNGVTIPPMEGRSLVPAFNGQAIDREAIYWEHEGNRAVRVGKWKLVAKGERGAWELYDLDADRTELNNLAAAQPERVKQMADLWQRWAERCDVLPLNPRRDAP